MNALNATELNLLNNLSEVRNSSVHLGSKLEEAIEMLPASGTPVNAVNATKKLTLTGVALDGETVTLGTDVYEFLADAAQSKTDPANIAVDITTYVVKATGTLTMAVQPTSGDTVTIGEKTYIFVPVGTANGEGEVSIGANLAGAKTALVAAINGTDDHNTAHTLVSAADFSSNDCAITAFIGGTAGNSIVTTETFTSDSNSFGSGNLATGANCSAANAVTALVAAVTASDTQGVGAAPGTGTTVDFTADVAGIIGNSIALDETMSNATFAGGATALSGGIDGTVGPAGKFMFDSSYIYVALAANTTAGKNWKKASLAGL